MPTSPARVIVPRVATARGLGRAAWEDRQRGALYLAGLRLRPAGPWYAGRMTPAMLALWTLETGGGEGEDNYNASNLRAGAWHGPVFVRSGVTWRAYGSSAEAARDALVLMLTSRLYRGPTERYLVSGDGWRWYREITAAGYSPGAPADFDRLFSRLVGVA